MAAGICMEWKSKKCSKNLWMETCSGAPQCQMKVEWDVALVLNYSMEHLVHREFQQVEWNGAAQRGQRTVDLGPIRDMRLNNKLIADPRPAAAAIATRATAILIGATGTRSHNIAPFLHWETQIWMLRCGIEKNYTDTTMVCEAHFHKDMILNHNGRQKILIKGAIPTLNLPPTEFNTSNSSIIPANTTSDVEIPSNTITIVETSNQVGNLTLTLDAPSSYAVPILNLPLKSSNTSNPAISHENTIPYVKIPNDTITNVEKLYQVNHSNFMENVIVKSLNAPSPQTKLLTDTPIVDLTTDIEPHDIKSVKVESSSPKTNKKQNEDFDVIINPMAVDTSSFTIEKGHKENFAGGTRSHAFDATRIDSSLADFNSVAKTITDLQKKIQIISKNPDVLKMLAVKIYLKCPQGYEILHRTFQLPQVSELKSVFDGCTISTDNDTLFASILQYKSEMMSVKQKDCVLCIGTMDVTKNLYYDIKRDKLIGVCDVNNIQKPEPAHKVLVLTMQGIYTDWKQPIDIAYLSNSKDDNLAHIDQWIETNIKNLLYTGFKVHALVCETDYLLMTTSTHHEIYRKIYCIYDVVSLLKWLFYVFLTHDYIFEGERAEMQHILDYVELDSKNQPRLTPKITEEILKPASIQDVNAEDVLKVISMETAAAMTTHINLNVLKPAAKNTVRLLTKMSMLLEVLYSNKCDNSSKEKHKRVLLDMITFFNDFKTVNKVTKNEVAAEETFVPKFQLTIKAILMLFEDMPSYDNDKALPTQRLNLKHTRSFFDRIKQLKKDNTKPSCKHVYLAFIQSALLNILRSTHGKKHKADLEDYLNEFKNTLLHFKGNPHKVNIPSDITIKCLEYNTLDFKNKDSIVLLAGFILKKCYDRHSDCDDMKNYTFIVLQDTSSICKTILKEIQDSVCVVPQETFIEFVEMMEIRFQAFVTKEILQSSNGFIQGLLKAMQPVTFQMPCSCFPIFYAKKLYSRVRIYDMLKYNNSCFTSFPEQYKYLVVNNL